MHLTWINKGKRTPIFSNKSLSSCAFFCLLDNDHFFFFLSLFSSTEIWLFFGLFTGCFLQSYTQSHSHMEAENQQQPTEFLAFSTNFPRFLFTPSLTENTHFLSSFSFATSLYFLSIFDSSFSTKSSLISSVLAIKTKP